MVIPGLASAASALVSAPGGVLDALEAYRYWFVYLGTVGAGELVIFPAFVLSGQGVLELPYVVLAVILGTYTTDIFWYAVGRFSAKVVDTREPWLFKELREHHLYLGLTLSKFVIGGRLLSILYLARRRVTLLPFLFFDLLGIVSFVTVLGALGWLAGRGVADLLPAYKAVTLAIFIALVGLALWWGAEALIKKRAGLR